MPKCETVSEKTGSSTSRMSCEIRLLDRKKNRRLLISDNYLTDIPK